MTVDLFNQASIKKLCDQYKFAPSKKYGQNYLIQAEVIEKIIQAADIKSDDQIVEIGPGFGTLTLALATRAKQVLSWEIEKKLQPYWQNILKQEKYKNIKIEWGNILHQDDVFKKHASHIKPYKVVANLPYQITSAVIRKFLENKYPPTDMVIMVQKEVAQRLCAVPGDLSVLAVAVQFYAQPQIVSLVSRNSFWPVPAVDSAIVKLKLNTKQWDIEQKDFFTLVKLGFSKKRKQLINNLLTKYGREKQDRILHIFSSLDLDFQCRAQDLSIEQWAGLYFALIKGKT